MYTQLAPDLGGLSLVLDNFHCALQDLRGLNARSDRPYIETRICGALAMSLVISDEILQTARMSEAELRQEMAILLFQKEN
jgi:hypothetical protein